MKTEIRLNAIALVGRLVTLSAGIACAALLASAQAPGGATAPPHETITPLNSPQNTVYLASGSTGSNNGIILASNGVILVDTGVSAASESVEMDELAKITQKPVTTAILTHSDGDHVNGLTVLPGGIAIIAQTNCKTEMDKANSTAQAAPGGNPPAKVPLPTKTVDMQEDVVIGGEHLHLFHVANAHTSGDLIVYLPTEKIAFTGDIMAANGPGGFPIIHTEKNGSSEGWIKTVTAIVALDANSFVPGHGAVQTKADVEQRLAAVKERRAQVEALVAQGKSLDDIKQQLGETAAPAANGGRGPRFPSFTEVVYNELTKKN